MKRAAPVDIPAMTTADCERYFRRRGLPSLVDEHSLRRDVYGRSAPFLLLVLLFELIGTVRLEWNTWQNTLAFVAGFVAVCLAYAGLNVLRQRPWYALPQSVDVPELTFFVLVPSALALVGGTWVDALATAVGNLVLLGIIRLVVGYGLLASLWSGLARLRDELGTSLRRLIRLLPLVLIFSMALFYNTEVWQTFDRISGVADFLLAGVFVLIIITLTSFGARKEADGVLADAAAATTAATTFNRRQRRNFTTMVATTQLAQVLMVSVGTGAFFTLAGFLSITPEVRELWQITGGTWSLAVTEGGLNVVMDQTLVRVAVALAVFNGLYYAINVQVDEVYRRELVDDLSDQVREVVRVRAHYLTLLDAAPDAPAPATRLRRWRRRVRD